LGIEGNEKKPKLRGGCYEREKQRLKESKKAPQLSLKEKRKLKKEKKNR